MPVMSGVELAPEPQPEPTPGLETGPETEMEVESEPEPAARPSWPKKPFWGRVFVLRLRSLLRVVDLAA